VCRHEYDEATLDAFTGFEELSRSEDTSALGNHSCRLIARSC